MNPENVVKSSREALPSVNAEFTISANTGLSAEKLMRKLAAKEKPTPAEVAEHVDNVASDLKEAGVPVEKEDIAQVKERSQQMFSSPSEKSRESVKAPQKEEKPMKEIDLKEYKQVLDGFARDYGVDNGAWATISGIIISSDIAGQALNGFFRKRFQTSEGWKNISHIFRDKISREELGLDSLDPKQFKDMLSGWDTGTWVKKGGTVTKLALQAAWPLILSPVNMFLERQGQKLAGKLFFTERAKLQEQVNNRIADSLYMRNFEFLHDQSAGEMMEVINRGKDASVDLMSVVYEQLIPLKYSQWISVFSQGIVNKWDMYAAIFKKVLLDTRIKKNAAQIQKHRAEELAQWDKVNTKLMTTLQGLETVRTSGNSEAGSDVLFGSLAERDFVEQGGLRQKRTQDREINKLFDVLDFSVPVITEGKAFNDVMKHGFVTDYKPDGSEFERPINAEDMFSQIFQGYFRVRGSQAEQKMLRQSFFQLTHLYTDRIIPDIQDIARMEQLLGPYNQLDHPLGLKERARIPAAKLVNYDIKVKNLKFKNILHNVNMDIPQGAFVTIKGPSGIGKTTFFRHLVGLYEGAEGTVSYGGVDLQKIKKYGNESIYNNIAYANQNPQYFEDMSLRDNLLLWTKRDIPDDKVRSVLRDLNLEHLEDRLDTVTKHYSGGEMRRIGIARALLKDPKVLFLDEPTANLDQGSTQQVLDIIQKMRKTHKDMTVVAVTHDAAFEKIAEQVVDFRDINKLSEEDRGKLGNRQVFYASAKP